MRQFSGLNNFLKKHIQNNKKKELWSKIPRRKTFFFRVLLLFTVESFANYKIKNILVLFSRKRSSTF